MSDRSPFLPTGGMIASAIIDGTIVLWDTSTGQPLRTLRGDRDGVNSVAFSPDGRKLVSGGNNNAVVLWDVASGRPLKSSNKHTDQVLAVAFSPDGVTIASGGLDKTIRLWATSGRELRAVAGRGYAPRSIVFSPDGQRFAANSDQAVRLWETSTGRELGALTGHAASVTSVAFSPDGQRVAAASWDRTIKIWDLSSGRELATLSGHTDGVNAIAFSPDGRMLVSGSNDRSVRLWDSATGALLRSYEGRSDIVVSVAYSPDGRTVASTEGAAVKLWDVSDLGEAAKPVAPPVEPPPAVATAAPAPVAPVEPAPAAKEPAPTPHGRRLALIVANGAYREAPLSNPGIDAGVVAASLEKIGFAVTVKRDVDLDGFEQALTGFAEAAKGADIALFYFAGHGFSIAVGGRQENLLMSTSANFAAKTTLALQEGGEPLEHVEETIIGQARATLIFVDACRNVPALGSRGVSSRGFAPINSESFEGAYVVLSDPPGQDGRGRDGGTGQSVRARLRVRGAHSGPADRGRVRPDPREGAGGDLGRTGPRRDPQRLARGRRRAVQRAVGRRGLGANPETNPGNSGRMRVAAEPAEPGKLLGAGEAISLASA